jgi:hypothetical protein
MYKATARLCESEFAELHYCSQAWIIPNAAKPQPKWNTDDTDKTDLHGLNIYSIFFKSFIKLQKKP